MNDRPPFRLSTARLVGRPPTERDYQGMTAVLADPRAIPWVSADGVSMPAQQVRRILDYMIHHWQTHGFGPWIFEHGTPDHRLFGYEARRMVGYAGLRHSLVAGRAEIELLYALKPDLWRQGLGREMAEAALTEDIRRFPVRSVVAYTLPTNQASRALMSSLGMVQEDDIVHLGMRHVLYRWTARSSLTPGVVSAP